MKKLMFVFSLMLLAGMSANAQACTKSKAKGCCAKKAAMTKADAQNTDTRVASAMTEAEIAAEANENITVRTCAASGTKSYYEKSTCAASGTVSWNQVEFCSKSKKFTRVASASMEKSAEAAAPAKKQCTKGDKAKCTKGAKASCTKKSNT